MKLDKLLRGLGSTLSSLFVLVLGLTIYSQNWQGPINDFFNISYGSDTGDDEPVDTNYYQTEFGDHKFNETSQAEMLVATKEHNYNEVAEGSVLFKNNGALPLKSNENKITIFGNSVIDFVYMSGRKGEGKDPSTNQHYDFMDVMEEAGFEINPTVLNVYENSGIRKNKTTFTPSSDHFECPLSVYTNEVKASFDDYNDAAIIFLAREYIEGNDAKIVNEYGISDLAISQNEKDMIDMVKNCGKFDKIIVLVNSTWPIEMTFAEDDFVDAVLMCGFPGTWGAKAIPDLLKGVVNPSGHTVDTWAANSAGAPACVNESTNTPKFTNVETIGQTIRDPADRYSYMATMVEGIYVGYKYYETRYEDCVLGRNGASNPVGAISGSTQWDYAKEMVYPFGYGLSYTTFSESIESVTEIDTETTNPKYEIKVKVKNTGDVAGKHAVQVYANTPYGEYEKTNLVEKASVNLVGFGKTGILNPNEETCIDIKVEKYLLASYDSHAAKGYILSAGDYYLGIGNGAHDALNNILAKKGTSGMVDALGNSVTGDADKVYTWNQAALDTELFAKSRVTGKAVTNKFDSIDLNYFYDTKVVTYLTRQDWAGTFPTSPTTVAATDEMIRLMKGDLYTKPADSPSMSSFTVGNRKGIPLIRLKGVDIDDPLWDEYLAQYTVEELSNYVCESFGTKAMDDFGVPRAGMSDGPLGLCSNLKYPNEPISSFACEPLLAGTFNVDIIYRRGELMGEHCLWTKCTSINGPGCNLHRTPFNGRNPIYFSEDGNMSYLVGVHEALGYRAKGASAGAKHFVLNDQEEQRQGVASFISEQGLRETSLRAFENILTGDNSYACMMSFCRVGCVSMNCDPLSKSVTRDEWGFKGFLQSDASVTYSTYRLQILDSGLDLFTADGAGSSAIAIKKQINTNDDGHLYQKLLLAVKHAQYCVVNSNVMNGIGETTEITTATPWWIVAEDILCVVVGLLAASSITLSVLEKRGILRKKKEKEAK